MKYTADTYQNFSLFFAKAIEIAKDKVGLYNNLLTPPMRKKTNEVGFQKFLEFIIYTLRLLGWFTYVALTGLVGLGIYAYFAGMGSLIASNPVIAAAIAALGGQSIYLIWKHREFLAIQKTIGDEYKKKFEFILLKNSNKEREKYINLLIKDCVKSLCIHAYQINSDEINEKITSEI
jgi:hypothetical protein